MTESKVAADCDELEVLRHIPSNPQTVQFRQWIVGDRTDDEISVEECVTGMLWSDHAVALESTLTAGHAGYCYFVDHCGDLQVTTAEGSDPNAQDAATELAGDLADDAIDVVAIRTEGQPNALRSVGKEIVTDGGRETRVGHCEHCDTDVELGDEDVPAALAAWREHAESHGGDQR